MNRTTLLAHLQMHDHDFDQVVAHLRTVDAALANDAAVVAARATRDAAQKKSSDLRGTLRDRELEAKSLDAKIKEIEARLYSGRITHPKELDGMEKDLQMHKRQRSALDDVLLGLMDAAEGAEKIAMDAARDFDRVQAARANEVERLTRERAELRARENDLRAAREQTRASLDAESLARYDRLRQAKAGRAVAPIKQSACGACGVTVPTGLASRVRAGEEVVLCPSCGRILAS
jgi:predicted  nucleic acid-binding Zn-ribbon protein